MNNKPSQPNRIDWATAKKNILEMLEKYPKLISDALDASYLHGIEDNLQALAEQRETIIKTLDDKARKFMKVPSNERNAGFVAGICDSMDIIASITEETP